jgi:hypothetical protein
MHVFAYAHIRDLGWPGWCQGVPVTGIAVQSGTVT